MSSDLFYDPEDDPATLWGDLGVLAVEMEAATVLAVAARHGVAAACVLAVSDLLAGDRRRRIAIEALEPVAADELDAVLAQQRAEELARRRAEVPRERRVLEHHHRAAAPERRQRRRDLAGDVGASDQHDVLGLERIGADRVGVAERAQVVDALELGALDDVEPTSHVVAVENALRADEPEPCLPQEVALAAAPDPANGGFRVPSPAAGSDPS